MPTAALIDFSSTPLASSYSTFYAKILDDVFTPSECASLIRLAETTPGGWKPAGLSAEGLQQTVHSGFRNSERIIRVDEDASQMIYDRSRPLVEQELGVIEPQGRWGGITGRIGRKQGETWKMVRVNPRLSFLRYTPGNYFKPHCDGLNDLNDGAQKSFVTLHLYLTDPTTDLTPQDTQLLEQPNAEPAEAGVYDLPRLPVSRVDTAPENPTSGLPGAADTPARSACLSGGATRFWTPDKKHFLDVEPKVGRVLVFQQRMLIHSGEEVTDGVKYTMRSDLLFEVA